MKGLLLPSSLPSPQWSRQNVRVPFSVTLRPKDPGPNSFGGPDFDSPQLKGCLRIKWYTGHASYNTYKLTNKDICIEQQSKQQSNAKEKQ